MLVYVIARSPSLEYLNLSSCLLQSREIISVINAINNFARLKFLDLGSNHLSNEEYFNIEAIIECNKGLEQLYFPNCALTHNKLKSIFNALKAIKMLKILDITLSKVDNQLADHVAAAIQSNRHMERLMLSGLSLEPEGLNVLSSSMEVFYGLRHFSMFRCEFTDQEVHDLIVIISNTNVLENFNLGLCLLSDINKGNILNSLKSTKALKHLNINGITINSQLEDDIDAIIRNNIKLEHLEMAQCNIGINMLNILTPLCSNLLHINFDNNKSLHNTGTKIANLISNNVKLKYINLCSCQLVPEDICDIAKALQTLSSLQHIDLSLNTITMTDEMSVDMAAIVTNNKKLEKIYFPTAKLNFKSIKIIIKAMSQVTSLTHVDLNINQVDESVATDVANLVNNTKMIEMRFSKRYCNKMDIEKSANA